MLDETENHSAFFANHALVPRRFPGEIHFRRINSRNEHYLAFGIFSYCWAHAASRSGQGHLHYDFIEVDIFLSRLDSHRIYEAEIDDIYRDFRIINVLQLLPNRFFVWLFPIGKRFALRLLGRG